MADGTPGHHPRRRHRRNCRQTGSLPPPSSKPTARPHGLFHCYQEDGENIDQYISALVRIHNRCGFNDEEEDRCLMCGHSWGHTNRLRECRIRDRLIFGLRDSSMQRVLLEDFEKQLTLDRVLQICKAHESSTDTGHTLSQDPSFHLLAARQSSYQRQAHANRPQRTTTEASSPCYYCGDGSHPRSQCPALRQFCQQCGQQGHFAVVCRQKAPQSVQQATLGHLYLHQTGKAGNHLISIMVTLHNDCQHEIHWLPPQWCGC